MKTLLKTLLILLLLGGLVAGGIYGYSRYTLRQPAQVQPVANWLLEYSPNQTYLGGSVVSGDSFFLYGEEERTPLEIYVSEGQAVRAGAPLVRYDTTKDTIELDEKLLSRQKLLDEMESLYKEYRRYAYVDYDRAIPTPTPTATPTPKYYKGTGVSMDAPLGVVRLSAPVLRDLTRIDLDGDGTEAKPYRYRLLSTNTVPDPVPESLLGALRTAARQQSVHAWFETEIGYLYLVCLPSSGAADRGSLRLTAMTKKGAPAGSLSEQALRPTEGDGSVKSPYVFSYTEGQEVPALFFTRYSREAGSRGAYIYTELRGKKLTVAVDFTSMGTCILRLKPTPQPTATPTPTPTPIPTPPPTPKPTPTATPEGWSDKPEPDPTSRRGGMSRAQREAYVEELTQQIRDGELSYRQLCHDIDRLQAATGQSGVVTCDIDGVVSTLNPNARSGEVLMEVRGGSGKGVISCMLGETELEKYPVGTELTGFSYDIGDNVTARVTSISPMPVTDSYSNGGNPNSSGYVMLLEVQGEVELPLYSYVEFTSFQPLSKTGAIYLYEAFVREIDGQDCIFVARDGILRKEQVHTGRRTMEYIELVGSSLTREDYIAFPYGKTVRDGAAVQITDGAW